ncbi:MAG: aldo/keto reductase [Armatimonadetes bacterium]|nr:aldo/keto reductase [Armatimonadota bacterium]MDE2206760.1 aldo/keto reductase [Armatimonadota bacterium]
MEQRALGTTGLTVTTLGLGCGGPSRLGLSGGAPEELAAGVIDLALQRGISFVDTAEAYGNEEVVGRALSGRRDRVVLCTKVTARSRDGRLSAAEFTRRAEACLQRLDTGCVDVLYLHGVSPEDYEFALGEILPAAERLREQGKVRHVGVTEAFGGDTEHAMLKRAAHEPRWEVLMVGYNFLNQGAARSVIAPAAARGAGIVIMFAVRRALRDNEALTAAVADLVSREPDGACAQCEAEEPLAAFLERNGIPSVPDAAYRFCLHTPGVHSVLSGTGDAEHLTANVASALAPPLPAAVTERLERQFAGVTHLSGG